MAASLGSDDDRFVDVTTIMHESLRVEKETLVKYCSSVGKFVAEQWRKTFQKEPEQRNRCIPTQLGYRLKRDVNCYPKEMERQIEDWITEALWKKRAAAAVVTAADLEEFFKKHY
jgi:hypothetical protein